VPGVGGYWTDVSPAQLAQMLQTKDFTLVNVKTPYMGEIDGTDLYIPYDQLKARASELPGDKGAKVLVYCRSGGESAVAAQTLLDLGYRNIWNLDGGMDAWTASGRKTVQKNR
jgi:rhodanese-related sulfurtransferase